MKPSTTLRYILLTILLLTPSLTLAVGIEAFSVGRLDVHTSANHNLPAFATGDVCAYAEAAAAVAGPANRTVPAPPPSVNCSIAFKTVPLNTLGIIQPGQGILAVPKFPAPFGTGATSGIGLFITRPATTTSRASASWASTESVGFLGNVDRDASLSTRANVSNLPPTPPGGTAASEADDPWFFSPLEDTDLILDIFLKDVDLLAQSDGNGHSFAAIETTGAFGLGDAVGLNPLASWSYSNFVEDNGAFSLASLPLLNQTFHLSAGKTYWLSAQLRSYGELNGVPEPASWLLLGWGCLTLIKRELTRARAC